MLPPFSWSFIPLYWQDGESKIMKVCKGFLWHGCRFFHLFLKHFPSLFMSFLAFYFCCVCVWDTTSHSGRAIYSSPSVEESLKGCVPSTQGLGWKTLWRKKSILGIPLKWPSQIEASYFGGYFMCPRKCVPPLLLSVVGQLPMFAPSSLARVAQKASEKKMASKLNGISQLVIIFLCFFVLHFKKGESTYKWTFQDLFIFDGYKGYTLTWMGYFPPSYSV